nr:MAG TPA: hypothetical protein [Caudoviricetes sp.]
MSGSPPTTFCLDTFSGVPSNSSSHIIWNPDHLLLISLIDLTSNIKSPSPRIDDRTS